MLTRIALTAAGLALFSGAVVAHQHTLAVAHAAPSAAVSTAATQLAPQNGVRCPNGFNSQWNSSTSVLRCVRQQASWVITICPDPVYSDYRAQSGRDVCDPTKLPGVGAPPTVTGTRPIVCSVPGYTIQNDREGTRDRCERTETQFAYPNQL